MFRYLKSLWEDILGPKKYGKLTKMKIFFVCNILLLVPVHFFTKLFQIVRDFLNRSNLQIFIY